MKVPFDEYEVHELGAGDAHWRNSFDSRYLRHFWLAGKPRVVTVARVQELHSKNSKTGETKKQLLITLAEADKPWAINVTNSGIIEMLTGNGDPRSWVGVRLELYPTKTRGPTGGMVDCIRVREKLPAADAKSNKPKLRQEVSKYLHAMKEAKSLDDMDVIMDAAVEDSGLSADEAALILDGNKRRRSQLEQATQGAT
jgi:hypothetical protein